MRHIKLCFTACVCVYVCNVCLSFCSCLPGICRRAELWRWPIYLWLPQTACWRPDSSCCPLSHWHHHPVQWPLQVQVQPGQEKEDRKQCSADAQWPRSRLWLLDVTQNTMTSRTCNRQITGAEEGSRTSICNTQREAFVLSLQKATGSSLLCTCCELWCFLPDDWATDLRPAPLHTHTRTYTHLYTQFLSLSFQSIEPFCCLEVETVLQLLRNPTVTEMKCFVIHCWIVLCS